MYVCQVIVIILLEIIGRSKNLLWYWWRCTLNCAFKKIKNWHKWKWTFIARVTKYNQPHSIRPRDTQEARRDQNTDPRLDRQGPSTTTPPRDDNNTHTKRAPNTRGQGPSHPRRPQVTEEGGGVNCAFRWTQQLHRLYHLRYFFWMWHCQHALVSAMHIPFHASRVQNV
jgi:hypothetical protein